MVKAKNLAKVYGMGNAEVRALSGVDFSVEKGEFVVIRGPSGCGKSTLLNILGCLDKPTTGTVHIEGVDITHLDDKNLAKIRREKIGFIFQSYNLIPTLNAIDNVMLPLMFAGRDKGEMIEKATRLLTMVGMQARMNHKPSELSGGEQQRVAIARALSNDPLFIVGDEPTGNLDSKSGAEVLKMLKKLHEEGRTLLLVTHDPAVAAIAQRVVWMKDGQFVENESKSEVTV